MLFVENRNIEFYSLTLDLVKVISSARQRRSTISNWLLVNGDEGRDQEFLFGRLKMSKDKG